MKVLVFASILSIFGITQALAESPFLAVKYNGGTAQNEIWSLDRTSSAETLLQGFTFPSGEWVPSNSYQDTTTGKLFLKDSRGPFLVFDPIEKTFGTPIAFPFTGYQKIFATSETLTETIRAGTDKDGNATTVIGSSNIVDSTGKTIIESKPDGSIHIGENSLVTIEENGAQSLYATNAAGQPIDINITRGSNLLVNGAPLSLSALGGVSRREIRNFDRRAVALSSALSALPNYSGDSPYSCGMGMGIRGDRSAMAIGCATDFSHFGFSKNMPSIIKNASFNAGSSFLMHDDADVTFKVGLSFKFGNPSSTTTVASRDHDLRYELNLVEQEKRSVKKKNKRLKELVEENKQLQARLDEIKARLADETKARLVAMAEIKMQLAALTEARVASN